jgi:hypothetical protein
VGLDAEMTSVVLACSTSDRLFVRKKFNRSESLWNRRLIKHEAAAVDIGSCGSEQDATNRIAQMANKRRIRL